MKPNQLYLIFLHYERRVLTRFSADIILVFDDTYHTARCLEEYTDDYGATEDKETGTEK